MNRTDNTVSVDRGMFRLMAFSRATRSSQTWFMIGWKTYFVRVRFSESRHLDTSTDSCSSANYATPVAFVACQGFLVWLILLTLFSLSSSLNYSRSSSINCLELPTIQVCNSSMLKSISKLKYINFQVHILNVCFYTLHDATYMKQFCDLEMTLETPEKNDS